MLPLQSRNILQQCAAQAPLCAVNTGSGSSFAKWSLSFLKLSQSWLQVDSRFSHKQKEQRPHHQSVFVLLTANTIAILKYSMVDTGWGALLVYRLLHVVTILTRTWTSVCLEYRGGSKEKMGGKETLIMGINSGNHKLLWASSNVLAHSLKL